MRARHGFAVLLDGHSIRSEVPRFFAGRLPDLNLGTASGASCAPALQARAAPCWRSADGFTHVVNGRFKGGWITRHYGRPQRRRARAAARDGAALLHGRGAAVPWDRGAGEPPRRRAAPAGARAHRVPAAAHDPRLHRAAALRRVPGRGPPEPGRHQGARVQPARVEHRRRRPAGCRAAAGVDRARMRPRARADRAARHRGGRVARRPTCCAADAASRRPRTSTCAGSAARRSSAGYMVRRLVEQRARALASVAGAGPPAAAGSSSPPPPRLRRRRTTNQISAAAQQERERPEPEEPRRRLDRRLVEDEVAVARDQVLLDLARRSCPAARARAPRGAGPRPAARSSRRATGSGRRGSAAPPRASSGARRARRRRAPARTRRPRTAAPRTASQRVKARHDFCSSRTSGRIFCCSASGRDRTDLLVADHAVLVDDERLGHAVHAPVDADAAVRVDDRHACTDRRSARATRGRASFVSL